MNADASNETVGELTSRRLELVPGVMLIGPAHSSVRGYGRAGLGLTTSRMDVESDLIGDTHESHRGVLLDAGAGFHAFVFPHVSLSGDLGLAWSRDRADGLETAALDVRLGLGISAWLGDGAGGDSAEAPRAEAPWAGEPGDDGYAPPPPATAARATAPAPAARRRSAGAPRGPRAIVGADGIHRLRLPLSLGDLEVLSAADREPGILRLVYEVDARHARLGSCESVELATARGGASLTVKRRETVSGRLRLHVDATADELEAWLEGGSPRLVVCVGTFRLTDERREALAAFVAGHRERAAGGAVPAADAHGAPASPAAVPAGDIPAP